MILGIVLLFIAIVVITPLVFFTLVGLFGKFFALRVEKDSWLRDKFPR